MEAPGLRPPTQWTLRLGRGLFGVPVGLHWALLLLPLLLFTTWLYQEQKAGVEPAYWRLLWFALLQTTIVTFFVYLHELGHSFTALQTGTPVPEIVLYPFGGAALMGAPMRSPAQELVVAFSGPLVNLVAMALLWALLEVAHLDVRLTAWTGSGLAGDLLVWMMYVNAGLSLLNLLPIFPLDGGSILRALLALRGDELRATHVTATAGQVLAVPLFLAGLYWGGLGGSVLVAVALLGFLTCMQLKSLVQGGGVYEGSEAEWGAGRPPLVEGERTDGVRGPDRPQGFWRRWQERRRRRRAEQAAQAEREFQEHVDAVLAKVKREGLPALTRAERRLLEQASEKARRRRESRKGKGAS